MDTTSQKKFREERTEIPFGGTLGTRVLFCFDRHCCLPTITEGGSDQHQLTALIVSSNAPETGRVAPWGTARDESAGRVTFVGADFLLLELSHVACGLQVPGECGGAHRAGPKKIEIMHASP